MGFKINNEVGFMQYPGLKYDPNVMCYMCWTDMANLPQPAQYHGWEVETMSWKKTAYLNTSLSIFMPAVRVEGPDAEKLLSHVLVNDCSTWKVGRGRHVISCSPRGNLLADGVGVRLADDCFEVYALDNVLLSVINSGKYDVKPFHPTYDPETSDFVFQIAGPRSLEIVENSIKEDIHDLKFMGFTGAKIAGHDVRVIRMGMGGTLSYEIHGKSKDMDDVYDVVMSVGEKYGMERLGEMAYMSNHTENGFPQMSWHFIADPIQTDEYSNEGAVDYSGTLATPAGKLHGSLASEGIEAYLLNPYETGWGKQVKFNHDFIGKEALEKISQSKHRVVTTLVWNHEDIHKILDTFLDDEEGVSNFMYFPQNFVENCGGNLQDKVLNDKGELIGKSTGRLYTEFYKEVISMAFIDPDYNEIGKELTVVWGDPDRRQVPVRATVARYPYLDLAKNKDFDMESIPHYQG